MGMMEVRIYSVREKEEQKNEERCINNSNVRTTYSVFWR
jgi:hypothetical protein